MVQNDVCEDHYDTVCETTYVEKDVIEDKPICEDIAEEMCDDNGENCMSFTRRVNILSSPLSGVSLSKEHWSSWNGNS